MLEQYATSQGVSSQFHAEVDNLLFDVNKLTQRLNAAGKSSSVHVTRRTVA